MNKPTLPRVDINYEAMRRVDLADTDQLDQLAAQLGEEVAAAVEQALERSPAARIDEDDRQRVLDAAFGDVMEVVNRHRLRLGRRVCSMSDARVTRQMFELLRSMAGPEGGADGDQSFQ